MIFPLKADHEFHGWPESQRPRFHIQFFIKKFIHFNWDFRIFGFSATKFHEDPLDHLEASRPQTSRQLRPPQRPVSGRHAAAAAASRGPDAVDGLWSLWWFLAVCYWKCHFTYQRWWFSFLITAIYGTLWSFRVDLPIKDDDFPYLCKRLPESKAYVFGNLPTNSGLTHGTVPQSICPF